MNNKKVNLSGFCHGITTLGERGQIVIPQEARKKMGLKQKDKLFVFSKFGQMLLLIKENKLKSFLDSMIPLGLPETMIRTIKTTAHKKRKR